MLRQMKVPKEKATRLSASLRYVSLRSGQTCVTQFSLRCGKTRYALTRAAQTRCRKVSSRSNAVLRQRCPQPEPRAAGADTRVNAGADGLQELRRNLALAPTQQAVAAIKINKEAIPHPVSPLLPTPATASSWGWQLHRRVQLLRHPICGNVFERSASGAQ